MSGPPLEDTRSTIGLSSESAHLESDGQRVVTRGRDVGLRVWIR